MTNEKQLIYKEDLIAEYDRVHIGEPGNARKLMEDAPTVDAVEVVHGRWSPVTYGLGVTVTRWMCSNCKKYENVPARTAYCPNCGAKMDGDRNE